MHQELAKTSGTKTLVSLLLTPSLALASAPAPKPDEKNGELLWLNVGFIDGEPAPITKAFATSIAKYGVITPILVEASDGGWHRLIAGRRRLAAAKAAEQKTIPALVVDRYGDGVNSEVFTIIENVFRTRNLSCELRAMRILAAAGHTDDDLQAMLGLPKRDFTKYAKLLGLQRGWIEVLDAGLMSPTTAAIIAGLKRADQDELLATREKDQRVTIDTARAFRLKKQYDTRQLTFLSTPLPVIEAPKW